MILFLGTQHVRYRPHIVHQDGKLEVEHPGRQPGRSRLRQKVVLEHPVARLDTPPVTEVSGQLHQVDTVVIERDIRVKYNPVVGRIIGFTLPKSRPSLGLHSEQPVLLVVDPAEAVGHRFCLTLLYNCEPLEPLDLPAPVWGPDDELRPGRLERTHRVSGIESTVQVGPAKGCHLRGVPEQPAHERALVSVCPRRDGPHRHRGVRADESERGEPPRVVEVPLGLRLLDVPAGVTLSVPLPVCTVDGDFVGVIEVLVLEGDVEQGTVGLPEHSRDDGRVELQKLVPDVTRVDRVVLSDPRLQFHVLARLVHMDVVDRRADEDSQEKVALELDAVIAVEAKISKDLSPEFTAELLDVRRLPFLGVRRGQLVELVGVPGILNGGEDLCDDAVEVPHLPFGQPIAESVQRWLTHRFCDVQPVPEPDVIQVPRYVRLRLISQPEVEVHAEKLQRVEFAREVVMFLDADEEVPKREPTNRAGEIAVGPVDSGVECLREIDPFVGRIITGDQRGSTPVAFLEVVRLGELACFGDSNHLVVLVEIAKERVGIDERAAGEVVEFHLVPVRFVAHWSQTTSRNSSSRSALYSSRMVTSPSIRSILFRIRLATLYR